MLQKNDIVNTVLVVVRWYGGTHLGARRFDLINRAGMDVLRSMGKDLKNDIDAPTISTSDTVPPAVESNNNLPTTDHNVFYDSTGKNLITKRMFGRDSTKKVWAPYIDNVNKLISNNQAEKSVTLMLGVRHARLLQKGSMSLQQYKSLVKQFINTTFRFSPNANIVLMSVLHGEIQELKHSCNDINSVLEYLADDSKVKFVDNTQIPLSAMSGLHVKKTHTKLIAVSIQTALGIQRIPDTGSSLRNRQPAPPVKYGHAGERYDTHVAHRSYRDALTPYHQPRATTPAIRPMSEHMENVQQRASAPIVQPTGPHWAGYAPHPAVPQSENIHHQSIPAPNVPHTGPLWSGYAPQRPLPQSENINQYTPVSNAPATSPHWSGNAPHIGGPGITPVYPYGMMNLHDAQHIYPNLEPRQYNPTPIQNVMYHT